MGMLSYPLLDKMFVNQTKYFTRRGKTAISVGVAPKISPSGNNVFCGSV
jgi:hypothetical protein